MARQLLSNRRELALLRGKRDKSALDLWAQTFGKGDSKRARRYALAVATFVGEPRENDEWQEYMGQLSPNTKQAYTFAVTEFFEWVAASHGKVVAPEDVTRFDAEKYVGWLSDRTFSLTPEKLKDGDMPLELAIYEAVKKLGRASLSDIVAAIPEKQKELEELDAKSRPSALDAFSAQVRSMIRMDVLVGTPTLEAVRKQHPGAGITVFEIDGEPLRDVYSYSTPPLKGVSRTTVSQRVAALSSFWKVLMQGENVQGGDPLLRFNIWDSVAARVNRGLTNEKRGAARRQKVPSELILKMLKRAPHRTLVEYRDRAMFYLMVFAALRTTELLRLRRGAPPSKNTSWKSWFDPGDPPTLHLVRKGGKKQELPYPSVALAPLIEFQAKLKEASEGQDDRARYLQELASWDAPLFPSVNLWGSNYGTRDSYQRPMTRRSLRMCLQRLARGAGLSDAEVRSIHPHAIRHFSANAMIAGGKDLREVQAILGHSSVTTTEGYLEDPEERERLSGQDSVMSYLQSQDAEAAAAAQEQMDAAPERPQEPEVIETFGSEATEAVEHSEELEIAAEVAAAPEVSPAELELLNALTEELPANDAPEVPEVVEPLVHTEATPEGEVVRADGTLIGIGDEEERSAAELENLQQTLVEDISPGSPDWVYVAMADKTDQERIVFNRGGERLKDWQEENYSALGKNFGVGHTSLLCWLVKAQGNITKTGYFRGLPPFPVFSPDQVNPETVQGHEFIERVEELYTTFIHGDTEKGLLPSPMRSVGLVRWFGFFAYHSRKLGQAGGSALKWRPWNSVVELGALRAHKDEWLLDWLRGNAHTFRASANAMRGVERGARASEDEITQMFLQSSFEGVDLITEMPDWMVEDDPVHALYKEDPKQYEEFVHWLRNVTGQQFSRRRAEDRKEQLEFIDDETRTAVRSVRDQLVELYSNIDELERVKREQPRSDAVGEAREKVRIMLFSYLLTASGETRSPALESVLYDSTKRFNEVFSEQCEKFEIPNPSDARFKKISGTKARIEEMVREIFEAPALESASLFAESELFNPLWFVVDDEKHTVGVEDPEERARIFRQFGQDPNLLTQRASRAMWEARNRGFDALWGIMMSYFCWIIPTGREMESSVRGIPVTELPDESMNREHRRDWLRSWVSEMKRLATEGVKREPKGINKDVQDTATRGLDFVAAQSVATLETPESLLLDSEEGFVANGRRRAFLPNKRGTYTHLEGERPKTWYKTDIFGARRRGLRPNAPPDLVSPGVVYSVQREIFPIRQLLPSPFRIVAAIDLE